MYNKTRKFRVTFDVEDLNPVLDDRDVKTILNLLTDRLFVADSYNILHIDIAEILDEKEPKNVTKH